VVLLHAAAEYAATAFVVLLFLTLLVRWCCHFVVLQVYEGQVVGVYNKSGDLKINVCKAKALTNMRASQSEKKVR
jgi:hypothetical protein